MKKNFQNRKILAMFFGAFIAGSSLPSAFTAGWLETITVRNGIQLNLNGENVSPVDASGKEMPVFLYDSTTYVPVRFLSEKYGKNLEWDKENAAVYITDNPQENPDDPYTDQDSSAIKTISLIDLIDTDICTGRYGVDCDPQDSEPISFRRNGTCLAFRLNGQYGTFSLQALSTPVNDCFQLQVSGITQSGETIVFETENSRYFARLKTYPIRDLETLTITKVNGGIIRNRLIQSVSDLLIERTS